MQPKRRAAGEPEHHGLAPRGIQPVLGCLADEIGAEAVGEDEAAILRDELPREVGVDGEIEPVAPLPVFRPFPVGAEIGACRI